MRMVQENLRNSIWFGILCDLIYKKLALSIGTNAVRRCLPASTVHTYNRRLPLYELAKCIFERYCGIFNNLISLYWISVSGYTITNFVLHMQRDKHLLAHSQMAILSWQVEKSHIRYSNGIPIVETIYDCFTHKKTHTPIKFALINRLNTLACLHSLIDHFYGREFPNKTLSVEIRSNSDWIGIFRLLSNHFGNMPINRWIGHFRQKNAVITLWPFELCSMICRVNKRMASFIWFPEKGERDECLNLRVVMTSNSNIRMQTISMNWWKICKISEISEINVLEISNELFIFRCICLLIES